MRAAVAAVLLAACAAPAAAPPRPAPVVVAEKRPLVAVLGVTADDPAEGERARALTAALRAQAAAPGSPFALARDRERELAEVTALATCPSESAACMAAIGADLRVDYLVYGHLRAGTAALALLEVAAHVNRRAAAAPVTADLSQAARAVYARLVDGVRRRGP